MMIGPDPEELEILEAYETGALESIPDLEEELRRHREIAEATIRRLFDDRT